MACFDIEGALNTNPQVLIDNCVKHFTNLFENECTLNDGITHAQSMLLKLVKGIRGQHVMIALEEDIKEEDVECVLSRLLADKCPAWDGIMNEFFKAFVQQVWSVVLFQEVWSSGKMLDSWKFGLVKLIPKLHLMCPVVNGDRYH